MSILGRIPKRWDTYTPMGEQIPNSKFIPFKTPLSKSLFAESGYSENEENSFEISQVLQNSKIGLIINLVSGHTRYDKNEILNHKVDYFLLSNYTIEG